MDALSKTYGSLAVTVGKGIQPLYDYRHEGTGVAKGGIAGSLQQNLSLPTLPSTGKEAKTIQLMNCQFYQLGAGGIILGNGRPANACGRQQCGRELCVS